MKTFKTTHGWVTQIFENGECIDQDFIAGDLVEWQDSDDNAIDPPKHTYFPFEMVKPAIKTPLIDLYTLTIDIVRDAVPADQSPTTIAMLKVIRELTGLGLYSAHKLLDKLESEEKGEKQQSS